jgi:putative selenium metabolism hydrolase
VVAEGDHDEWEVPPFSGEVSDGYLHGRGAMDIKGPLALQTHAAARFVDDRPAGDLIVAHTVLEERGGWGMAHLVEAGEVRPAAVVLGEATAGDICIGHRGRAELVVEVRGLAGHASAPERARNALDGLGPVLDAVRSFQEERLTRTDPILGRSTVVATAVTASPESRNVIPDRATVVLDWRVLPELDADAAVRMLTQHLRERVSLLEGLTFHVAFSTEREHTWTGLEQFRRMFGPGYLLPPYHPVPVAAAAAVERSTGRRPGVRPWRFATDGGHACGEHGIPTIGYAPGEERHAHTNKERLDLGAARKAFDAYPAVIRAVFEALA